MSIKHLYEDERPALLLDFANSKTVDPRITFTRSSTATYVDEQGVIKTAVAGEARIDHDPATGECLGLLIEEARTNILPESGDLNDQTEWHTSTNPGSLNQSANAGWMVATANTTEVVSPDGTNNACKLSGLTTSTFDKNYKVHVVANSSNVSMSANVDYTWTLFVKDPDSVLDSDNQLTFMYGSKFSNTNAYVRFDLSNDTYTFHGDINNESASITPYPNGWKKLTATFTNTSSGGGPRYFLQELSPQTNSVTQFSANGEKFYVWGFQIEQGSFGTSYIPTSGSTYQRLADEAEITGTNFSSWWNSSEGTIVTIAKNFPTNSGYRKAWEFNKGGTNPTHVPSGPTLVASAGNGTSFFQSPVNGNYTNSTVSIGSTKFKTALAFATGDIAGCGDGGSIVTATSGLDPNVKRIHIGGNRSASPGEVLNGHISLIAYYNTRLGNTTLEALTK